MYGRISQWCYWKGQNTPYLPYEFDGYGCSKHMEGDFSNIFFRTKSEFFCKLKGQQKVPNWLLEEEKEEVVAPTPSIILTCMLLAPKFEGQYVSNNDLLYVVLFSSNKNVPRYVVQWSIRTNKTRETSSVMRNRGW